MRNEFVTLFWRNAYESLPGEVRARYRGDFIAAERWELTVGGLIEAWSSVKAALAGLFYTPRARHGH